MIFICIYIYTEREMNHVVLFLVFKKATILISIMAVLICI